MPRNQPVHKDNGPLARVNRTPGVNVWLDAIFFALYAIVLIALVIHFLGSIPKGRFRKKFILGKWPEACTRAPRTT